jgi:hypothetical protein
VESFDYAGQREAAAGPGSDTRQWISNGIVNADTATAKSVDFTAPEGPLVSVRLHPSDIDVRCRVASFIAGTGQGEWHPFVGGDEVLVALPQGHERGGAIIVGRLNNGVDKFPTNVGNQDVTQNSTTVRTSIPNYVWQISNGWLLRSVTTSAQMALDVKGNWTFVCGDLHFMQLGSGGVYLATAQLDGQATNPISFLQIDATTGKISLSAGTPSSPGKALLSMDPSTGNIYASTTGALPVGHVATVEGMVGLIAACLTAFGALITLSPVTPPQVIVAMETGIAAAGTVPPYATFAALVSAALAKPRDPTGLVSPGLGSPGFFV